jgi:hypothetical protein
MLVLDVESSFVREHQAMFVEPHEYLLGEQTHTLFLFFT